MNQYNKIQRDLVHKVELAHVNGLRHSGLSGTVCEDLLIRALRKSFPKLRFDRGVVKFGDQKIVGADLKSDQLSSQFDVIIYQGKPLYDEADNVVVGVADVVGVIEIKKWMTLKMFTDLANSFKIIDNRFIKKADKKIPIILVAFRCHDRHRGIKWWQEQIRDMNIFCAICFSGNYSHKNGINLYPHEEEWFGDFDSYGYAGQYEKLVDSIKKLK